MTGMRARRKRLVGLTYLVLAAVAIAIAVLIFTIIIQPGGTVAGDDAGSIASGILLGLSVAFIVGAVIEFITAHRYARIGAS